MTAKAIVTNSRIPISRTSSTESKTQRTKRIREFGISGFGDCKPTYHMTLRPRPPLPEKPKKNVPYGGRTLRSDRARKTRTVLLETRAVQQTKSSYDKMLIDRLRSSRAGTGRENVWLSVGTHTNPHILTSSRIFFCPTMPFNQ